MKIALSLTKTAIALTFTIALSACSKKEESEKYSYDLTCNSCPTGNQTFSSHGAYCEGLLNESLNNSCCRNQREQTYNAQCK